jgi:hypothetical protein
MADDQLSSLTVRVFDGTRQPMADGTNILYRIFDGTQHQIYQSELKVSAPNFKVPFFDNLGDNYRVIVFSDGYYQAGFTPVPMTATVPTTLDLMLLPKKSKFDFSRADWATIKQKLPFLADGVDPARAQQRYADLMANRPKSLAALLNITTAMSQIFLPTGTPLGYLKQIIWDDSMAQDRFFSYCDVALIEQVRQSAKQGFFEPEFGSGFFHPGATDSWKQVQFGEANVQLTFHQGSTKTIDGLECMVVEPDIDYFKDIGAHGLLEVVPNLLTHGLTNPESVYILRWIAGQHAGVPEFDPPFTIAQA